MLMRLREENKGLNHEMVMIRNTVRHNVHLGFKISSIVRNTSGITSDEYSCYAGREQ